MFPGEEKVACIIRLSSLTQLTLDLFIYGILILILIILTNQFHPLTLQQPGVHQQLQSQQQHHQDNASHQETVKAG